MPLSVRRRPRVWFQLRWPFEVTGDQLDAALSSLNGHSTPRRRDSLVLVAVGQGHLVTHHLGVRETRSESVRSQLEAAIPGLAVVAVDELPALEVDRCWRGWISTNTRPLATGHAEATARGLLTALASAEADEVVALRWVLGPVRRPKVPLARKRLDDLDPGIPDWLADAVTGPRAADDPEARAALVDKQGRPGWRASLHLGVGAVGRRRQRQLLGAVAAAVRVTQAAGAQIGFRPTTRLALAGRRLPWGRPLLVNVAELGGLAGWPLGATEELPVDQERSRLLRPSPLLTHTGRVLAVTTYPSAERPLGLSAADALHHLYVLGPTGTGKTTLLENVISQDMADGRSVVVIEPRGDLVADVLARVPDHRVDDVVVIDPTEGAILQTRLDCVANRDPESTLGAAATPPPTPAELVGAAPIPDPAILSSPGGRGLTGLESLFWAADPGPVSVSVTIRGWNVTGTLTADRWTWATGDGGRYEASRPGSADDPAARHVYETKDTWPVSLQVSWSGSYTVSGFGTSYTVTGLTTTGTAGVDYPVIEVRGVVDEPEPAA